MPRFTTQVFSDVIRDGLGVELCDPASSVIAEIFRSDAKHTVTLNTYRHDVPLDLIERLIARARLELDPFPDGTPLSGAADTAAPSSDS